MQFTKISDISQLLFCFSDMQFLKVSQFSASQGFVSRFFVQEVLQGFSNGQFADGLLTVTTLSQHSSQDAAHILQISLLELERKTIFRLAGVAYQSPISRTGKFLQKCSAFLLSGLLNTSGYSDYSDQNICPCLLFDAHWHSKIVDDNFPYIWHELEVYSNESSKYNQPALVLQLDS